VYAHDCEISEQVGANVLVLLPKALTDMKWMQSVITSVDDFPLVISGILFSFIGVVCNIKILSSMFLRIHLTKNDLHVMGTVTEISQCYRRYRNSRPYIELNAIVTYVDSSGYTHTFKSRNYTNRIPYNVGDAVKVYVDIENKPKKYFLANE
jgi:hypothetical protein